MSYIQKNKAFITLAVLLFISVTLNVFSLGAYYGRHTQNSDVPNSTQAGYIKQADQELRKALPKADKKILRKIMKKYRPELKEKKDALRDIRKQTRQMMQSETFDRDQMHSLMAKEKQAREDLFSSLGQAKLKAMEEMSPQGRDALSKIDMTHFSRKGKSSHSQIENRQKDHNVDREQTRREIIRERRERMLKNSQDRDAY